jgi:hypothetical protein
MKLNMRNIGGTYYTEYVAKDGETLKQIAKEQLHNENLIVNIYRVENNAPNLTPINPTQNITGWTLLLPPIPADFLSKYQSANKVLAELKDKADKGTITAEDYYAQRKLVLSVL